MERNTKSVVITTVMGEKYTKVYQETFRQSQLNFVNRINSNFIIIDRDIEISLKHSHPSWQKLLMFRREDIFKYERVLFIDADVYITKHAKNPFEVVGDVSWSMAKNNAYDLPVPAISDLKLYYQCPESNRPDFMLNAGVFIVSKACKPILEHIFYSYTEQPCYDNGPFSYHLLNSPNGVILPSEFNTIVFSYIQAYGCSLSSILNLYYNNSFLHFVASKWRSVFYFIRWFDNADSVFLKKIVRFFGKKEFDFITIRIFKLTERIWGIYDFRIKKIVSKFFA